MMNCPHCNTHIDEHPASRCLDAWVANVVMGYPHGDSVPYGYGNAWLDKAHAYSRSIAAAWEVVEKLNQSGYIVEIINDCVAWSVVFRNIDTDERFTSDWKASLEVQVCRAAIKASQ